MLVISYFEAFGINTIIKIVKNKMFHGAVYTNPSDEQSAFLLNGRPLQYI